MPLPVLTQALLIPAEHSLRHLLRHAPAARLKLKAFHGQVIALDIQNVARINLRLLNDAPELSLGEEADAAVCLRGQLNDFLELARADDKASSLMKSRIEIDGDTDLAMSVTRILQNAGMDWESFISPLTGGLLAHQIGRGLRHALRWGHQTSATLQQAGRDYLQDETGVLAPPALVSDFSAGVDQLRLAADRIEARITRLEAQQTQTPTSDGNER